MPNRKIPHVREGDPISAALFNEVAEKLERCAGLSVAWQSGLTLTEGPWGRILGLNYKYDIWAKLSGTTSPYSWVEVAPSSAGGWATFGNRGGTNNAYEINGQANLNGKVIRLTWTDANDGRFVYEGQSSACSPGQAQICATVTDDGCGGILIGATITVKQGSTVIGTCITDGKVTSLTLNSGGAGYTNGTGYALGFSGGGGSGAAGTFDVVGGHVTNLVLSSQGTGYTSDPTVSLAAAGGGVGGSVTANATAGCCIPITSSGTYTVTCDVPGTTTKTTTINATCSLTANNVTFTYSANSLGTFCVTCTTCNCSGTTNVSGATVSLTGAGSVSGTTNASGQYCVRLGAGNYTASVTFPSGFNQTFPITIVGCATNNRTVTSITAIAFAIERAPVGCTATFTLKISGSTVGTCSITAANGGPFIDAQGTCCMTIPEVATGTSSTYDLTTSGGVNNASNQPLTLTCLPTSAPVLTDFGSAC